MKTIFLDIETVPTDPSLQENGLLEAQIQLNEAELLKKLSLSAVTAKIICICYAVEPPVGCEVQALQGEETEIINAFWKLAADCNLFVGHNRMHDFSYYLGFDEGHWNAQQYNNGVATVDPTPTPGGPVLARPEVVRR